MQVTSRETRGAPGGSRTPVGALRAQRDGRPLPERRRVLWRGVGTFGFSWIGLVFLIALFAPNIAWARSERPIGYSDAGENPALAVLEHLGQVTCTVIVLIVADTNPGPWSAWSWWLLSAVALMVIYELAWIRYFRSSRTTDDFYRPLGPLPVPLAVLPCAAFLLLGIYGRAVPLIVAALILSVGHIGIHLGHVWDLAQASRPPAASGPDS